MQELLVTESNRSPAFFLTSTASYVSQLSEILNVFMKPMLEKKILEKEDTDLIFPNIEILHQLHSLLEKDIRERMQSWSEDHCIGDMYCKMVKCEIELFSLAE